MRVARGEVDVILRSLGYMRPSLGKFWQPNRVRAGVSPALPTPPRVRVRTGRFIVHPTIWANVRVAHSREPKITAPLLHSSQSGIHIECRARYWGS